MNPVANRRPFWLLFVSLVAALLLQLPLAWAIVYLNSPSSQGETSVIFQAPAGTSSNIAKLRVENNTHLAIRWVSITGWSAAYSAPVFRSDEGQLFIDEPVWPFKTGDLIPGLADPTKWPAAVTASPSFVAGTYGETLVISYAVGWPYLCATGRTDRNPATGVWTHSAAWLLPEPGFRRWTLLGCVPLCYQPRWQGIIANTFALGIPIFICCSLFDRVLRIRRSRRRRRGLCPNCAYDLRATPPASPCPECGHSQR